ncbi:MAG: hypothetical protein QF807_02385 [Candidatus Thalassarchaeaceae archaeon]|nr:hypothetical protein [Candidatus Thalassarchaeaceae archaeon]MDP7042847.1 hypothetical protein [Candidatus Thalassarchaeaceae archaeon]
MSRPSRQPAIRMFAREYFESDLIEKGSGEYDPTFVITKLGAKVNRMMVAGLLERMERRDSDNGANYRGAIRDPTGLHMFSVASFQPELHAQMEELLAKFEQNEGPILLLAIGKCNPYQSDEGNVFTGIRLEQYTTIDSEGNANWLVETADATLRRIDIFQKSRDLEPSADAYRAAGIPADLADGLITGRGHYSNVEPDVYMLTVYLALDRAEGNMTSYSEDSGQTPESSSDKEGSSEDSKEFICSFLLANDPGDGVPYDAIMQELASTGVSRSDGEAAVDALIDAGLIFEQTFGFLRHIDSK